MDWTNRWSHTFPWGVRFDVEPSCMVIRPKRGTGVCIAHCGNQDFIRRTFAAASKGFGPYRMRWVRQHPSYLRYQSSLAGGHENPGLAMAVELAKRKVRYVDIDKTLEPLGKHEGDGK